MEKEKREVRIAGRSYTLSSAETPEHIDRTVRLLNARLNEVYALSSRIDKETAAIAAALSLADELIKAQDDNTRLRKNLIQSNERKHDQQH